METVQEVKQERLDAAIAVGRGAMAMVGCAYCGKITLRFQHADHAYRCEERRKVVEQRDRDLMELGPRERELGDNEY
jgi:ribosomal protein S27E